MAKNFMHGSKASLPILKLVPVHSLKGKQHTIRQTGGVSLIRNKGLERKIREARETSKYAHYSSSLESLRSSLGIDPASEIRSLGCRDVLDLGCGKATALGELHSSLPGVRFHGLNFVEEPEFAGLRSRGVNVRTGDWENLSRIFGDNSMDFIHWNYGVEHCLNVKRDLFQISRVLRKGGRLVFNVRADEHNLISEVVPALKNRFKVLREIPTTYSAWQQNWDSQRNTYINGGIVKRPGIAFYVEKI